MKSEIEDLIKNSGNNFHCKVIKFFREQGWSVLISPYYNDNLTNKPREIDIIAEKAFNVQSIVGMGNWKGTLNVKLFIECKWINQKIIFWFDKKDQEKATRRIINDSGLEHSPNNTAIFKHHYYTNDLVAKLFVSKKENFENEIIYKALNQSINAMVYYRKSNTIVPKEEGKIQRILYTLNYPIIVCNDFKQFYKVDINADNNDFNLLDNNFQLEINYAYIDTNKLNQSDYFLVDIVDFNKLGYFLTELEKSDIAIIREKLSYEN